MTQAEYCVWYCAHCGLEFLFPRKIWEEGADGYELPKCEITEKVHEMRFAYNPSGDEQRTYVTLDDSMEIPDTKVDRFEKILTGWR